LWERRKVRTRRAKSENNGEQGNKTAPISDDEPARGVERNEDENLEEAGSLGRDKPISQVL
jgi:hypothetical protein